METPTEHNPLNGEKVETAPKRTIVVDPLKGASVAISEIGQPPIEVHHSWGDVPILKVNKRIKASVIEPDMDAQKLTDILNDPRRLQSVMPLPLDREDTSSTGTRGLYGVTNLLPGRIACFSGVGIVRSTETWLKKPSLIVDSPMEEIPLSRYMKMGTMYVDAEGNVWSKPNNSPFGAYRLTDSQRKVEQTNAYGRQFGVEIAASGRYEGTNMGWLVYTLPDDVLNPTEALVLDLKLPSQYKGSIYGDAVYELLSETRRLHEQGIIHRQIHPGNWYVRFDENSSPHVVIADWETAAKLDEMSPSDNFKSDEFLRQEHIEKYFAGLSPQERARALDLYNAFASPGIIETDRFRNLIPYDERQALSVKFSPMWVTQQSLDYQLLMYAHSVSGYLHTATDQETIQQIFTNLKLQYAPLALDSAKRNKFYSGDSLEELIEQDHSEYAIRQGLEELRIRLARICASTSSQELSQNLLLDASMLSMPNLFIPS